MSAMKWWICPIPPTVRNRIAEDRRTKKVGGGSKPGWPERRLAAVCDAAPSTHPSSWSLMMKITSVDSSRTSTSFQLSKRSQYLPRSQTMPDQSPASTKHHSDQETVDLAGFVSSVPSPLTIALVHLSPHITWIRRIAEITSWKSRWEESWLLIAAWWVLCLLVGIGKQCVPGFFGRVLTSNIHDPLASGTSSPCSSSLPLHG